MKDDSFQSALSQVDGLLRVRSGHGAYVPCARRGHRQILQTQEDWRGQTSESVYWEWEWAQILEFETRTIVSSFHVLSGHSDGERIWGRDDYRYFELESILWEKGDKFKSILWEKCDKWTPRLYRMIFVLQISTASVHSWITIESDEKWKQRIILAFSIFCDIYLDQGLFSASGWSLSYLWLSSVRSLQSARSRVVGPLLMATTQVKGL